MNNIVLIIFLTMIDSVFAADMYRCFSFPNDFKAQVEKVMDQEQDLNKIVMNVFQVSCADNRFSDMTRHELFSPYLLEKFLYQKVQQIPQICFEKDKSTIAALLLLDTSGGNLLNVRNYIETHEKELKNLMNQFDYYGYFFPESIKLSRIYHERFLDTYRKIARSLMTLGFKYNKPEKNEEPSAEHKVFGFFYNYAIEVHGDTTKEIGGKMNQPDWTLLNILKKANYPIVIPDKYRNE